MSRAKVGRMIRALRERTGLTQAALARKARVAQSYIAMVEAGTSAPEKTLARIARALGVSMTELTAGRLVSRLGEDPLAPFVFEKGDRVASRGRAGVVVDGVCWHEPGGGWFSTLYRVRSDDGDHFDATGPELKPIIQRTEAATRIPGTTDRYRAPIRPEPSPAWVQRIRQLVARAPEDRALDLQVEGHMLVFTAPPGQHSLQVLKQRVDPLIAAANGEGGE